MLEAVEAVRPTALIGVRRHDHSLTSGALAGDSSDERNVGQNAADAKPRLFTQGCAPEDGRMRAGALSLRAVPSGEHRGVHREGGVRRDRRAVRVRGRVPGGALRARRQGVEIRASTSAPTSSPGSRTD